MIPAHRFSPTGFAVASMSSTDPPLERIYAILALITGAASDVPCIKRYVLFNAVVSILVHGAAISTRFP
jgi:hypothetical protein